MGDSVGNRCVRRTAKRARPKKELDPSHGEGVVVLNKRSFICHSFFTWGVAVVERSVIDNVESNGFFFVFFDFSLAARLRAAMGGDCETEDQQCGG